MSTFQRLVAIPQEEYLSLLSMQNIKEPLGQHFHNLENAYAKGEMEKDPYRRLLLQSNTLDQMKQVKEQIRDSLAVSTPKPYLSRAKALFQTLETFLKFNTKGEIYSDDGDVIPGSRLEDLIQHAVRDRRRNLTPTGWNDFLTILSNHNVPKSLLNRNTLDEMEETAPPVMQRPILNVAKKRVAIKEEADNEDDGPPDIKQRRTQMKPVRFQPARKGKPDIKDFSFLKRYRK